MRRLLARQRETAAQLLPKPIALVSIKPRSGRIGICDAVREAQGTVAFTFIILASHSAFVFSFPPHRRPTFCSDQV